jgi:hypothetical protein
MKKIIVLSSSLLLAAVTGEVMAANCTPGGAGYNRLGNALANTLRGKTACATEWQEYHSPSGALIDYKQGPNHPIDPTEQVGTWSVSGGGNRNGNDNGNGNRNGNGDNSVVTYNYGSGGTYSYTVYQIGNSNRYDFCGQTNITGVVLKPGQVPC